MNSVVPSFPGSRRAKFTLFLISAAGLTLSAGCNRESAKAGPAKVVVPPVPAVVATAVQQDAPVQIREIGRVEPYFTVTIRPQVSGQVAEVHFSEGQEVKAGDLLYTIDARPFEAAVKRVEANLARDTALARDAADEARRQKDLLTRRVGTQREYDEAQAKADAAQATVRADGAMVETARLQLLYCSIRSPITGRTGSRLIDRGNVVKENETALVVINQLSPVYVAFSVPERHLAEIKGRMATEKLSVAASIPPDPRPVETGVLTFLDNEVQADTGTVGLKATFENAGRRLWAGQFVQTVLKLTVERDAVVIPTRAIQIGQAGEFVYVLKGDTVDGRPIKRGVSFDDLTAVSGVNAGEVVVTDGQLRLAPGAKVTVKPAVGSRGATTKPSGTTRPSAATQPVASADDSVPSAASADDFVPFVASAPHGGRVGGTAGGTPKLRFTGAPACSLGLGWRSMAPRQLSCRLAMPPSVASVSVPPGGGERS